MKTKVITHGYSKEVYEHLGFVATDVEQSELGVRYIPMKYSE